jgi:hypothetical protein
MSIQHAVAAALIGLSTQAVLVASTGTKATSKGISREAQVALVCQVVSDWSAFQLAELIRGNAKESRAADPQGMEILRQIRLTEGLASIAFDKLAPEANHDAIYQDAVGKMRLYVNEDGQAADANAKRMVTVCQRTYRRMALEGALTTGEIQAAWNASRASVTQLAEELEAQGYSVRP